MSRNYTFSSESVTEGHPDKVADQISDAILDAHLRGDPMSRVACETFLTSHNAIVGGEISSNHVVDYDQIIRKTITDIGYDSDEMCYNGHTVPIIKDIIKQAGEISKGVTKQGKDVGAGDQGMMFGYAQGNTIDMMPLPISLAHGLTRALAKARRSGKVSGLRPDGKAQVSVRFEGNNPVAVDAIVLATQHDPSWNGKDLGSELKEKIVHGVIPEEFLHDGTKFYINHTGSFVTGGPAADTGLTGRKIIVDTYGGWVPHGGGAFSGKDPTKVDRSAAYYARYVAKNLVKSGLAEELMIQVAYSIGSVEPVSIHVDSFGTGAVDDNELVRIIREEYSFAPGSLIEELGLRAPIYGQTASYGHFGKAQKHQPWEQLRNKSN